MTGLEISSSEPATVRVGRGKPCRHSGVLLGGLALLLGLIFGLQQFSHWDARGAGRLLSLAEHLPSSVSGWRGEDRPMANTEALAGMVKEVLNYDDAILRTYHRNNQEFSVFLAYWQAGKMPARTVAFHIPDKCWVAAGWVRVAADYDYRREWGNRPLAPAQYREFVDGTMRQHVIYWHIYNGQAIRYNPNGSPSDLSMLTDLLRRGLRQKGEQYFIRIASASPIETLWAEPGFQDILELIAPLGPGLNSTVEQF